MRESGLRIPVSWPGKDGVQGMDEPFKIKVNFEGSNVEGIRVYALYVGT